MTKVMSSARTSSFGGGGIEYTVQDRDTLEGIAARYDCTPGQLLKMNKLPSRIIFPGQKIHIPDGQPIQEPVKKESQGESSGMQNEWKLGLDHENSTNSSPAILVHRSSSAENNAASPSSMKQQSSPKPATVVDPELDAECVQRFLKIHCKHFTDKEGVVGGLFLVTPGCIMFDPDVNHPLVIENGADRYGMVAGVDTIVSATLYKDALASVAQDETKEPSLESGQIGEDAENNTSHGNIENDTENAKYGEEETEISRNSAFAIDTADQEEPESPVALVHASVNRREQSAKENPPRRHLSDTDATDLEISGTSDTENENQERRRSTEHRQRTNSLGDTLLQGAQAIGSGVGMLGGSLLHGAFAVAKMPQVVVSSVSSGLFGGWTDEPMAEIPRMQENWFSQENEDKQITEQVRRQQNYALLARLQQKTAEEKEHWAGIFACATLKDEYPNLFASVTDMLPSSRQSSPGDLPHNTELPFYLCIRLDEKCRLQQRQPRRESIVDGYEFGNKTKTEFWFTVPRDKVEALYAFLVQWSPETMENQEEEKIEGAVSLENSGFVLLNANDEDAAFVHDEYEGEPSSVSISLNLCREWEIVRVVEVKRRLSLLDIAESLIQPLPDGALSSVLLDEEKIRCLIEVLPARAQGYPWSLIYSSESHGFSLRTLYRKMHSWRGEVSPTLLVIKGTQDRVFGAIVNCPIRMSDHFYGSGESLLFTFYPNFAYYRWTGENDFVVKGNPDSLSIGAGRGVFGLWLDGDFYHGRSQHCQTFDNSPLTGDEDFIISGVEAWGFSLD